LISRSLTSCSLVVTIKWNISPFKCNVDFCFKAAFDTTFLGIQKYVSARSELVIKQMNPQDNTFFAIKTSQIFQ